MADSEFNFLLPKYISYEIYKTQIFKLHGFFESRAHDEHTLLLDDSNFN